MGIEKIDSELCTGCCICVDTCPMDVIRFDGEKEKAHIAYPEDCGVCFQCAEYCPVDAIIVSSQTPRALLLPY